MSNQNSILLGNPLIVDKSTNKSRTAFQSTNKSNLIPSIGDEPIDFFSEGHLITIAPTGAGKGRSAIIPNLLKYEGSVIVIDPKGENYQVTSEHRKKMGQKIIKLDPFGSVEDGLDDTFNPFDILEFTGKTISDEVRALIEAILGEPILMKGDPFWDMSARSLIAGLGIYLTNQNDYTLKNLTELRRLLYNDDVVYNMAKTLDDKKVTDQEAYEEMASYLQGADRTRADILMSAQQYFGVFGSPSVKKAISNTSFDLNLIVDGNDFTIYIIIPPHKIMSHHRLLRVWVGALMSLISSRKAIPPKRTLFMLDEVAQLGNLKILETAITLLRGVGLTTWSFWQDLSQLKKLYPQSWESILNNCSVVQLFGARNFRVAQDFADISGASSLDVKEVALDEQILIVNNEGPLLTRRLDYLSDTIFANLFSPNPYYEKINK